MDMENPVISLDPKLVAKKRRHSNDEVSVILSGDVQSPKASVVINPASTVAMEIDGQKSSSNGAEYVIVTSQMVPDCVSSPSIQNSINQSEVLKIPDSNDLDKYIPVEEPGKPVQCSFCNREFTKVKFLKLHIKTHASDRYTCQYCGRVFTHNGGYQRHLLTHTARKSFECSSCGASFSDNEGLQKHLFEKHCCGVAVTTTTAASTMPSKTPTQSPPARFRCGVCATEFASRVDLHRHVKSSHDASTVSARPHQCNVCSSTFINRGNLTAHMKVHGGERPYVCGCGKGFGNLGLLKIHAKTHRGDSSVDVQTGGVSVATTCSFSCLYCKTVFASEDLLHEHVKTHHVAEQKAITAATTAAMLNAEFPSDGDLTVPVAPPTTSTQRPISIVLPPGSHGNPDAMHLVVSGSEVLSTCGGGGNEGLVVMSGAGGSSATFHDGKLVIVASAAGHGTAPPGVNDNRNHETLQHVESVINSVIEADRHGDDDDSGNIGTDVALQSEFTASPIMLDVSPIGGATTSVSESFSTATAGDIPSLVHVLSVDEDASLPPGGGNAALLLPPGSGGKEEEENDEIRGAVSALISQQDDDIANNDESVATMVPIGGVIVNDAETRSMTISPQTIDGTTGPGNGDQTINASAATSNSGDCEFIPQPQIMGGSVERYGDEDNELTPAASEEQLLITAVCSVTESGN